jgi:hypothetical protein
MLVCALLDPTHCIMIKPDFNRFICQIELKLIACIGPVVPLFYVKYLDKIFLPLHLGILVLLLEFEVTNVNKS